MFTTMTRLIALMTVLEKRRFLGAFVASASTGLIQVASVGSIIPFVAILLNPELLHSNSAFRHFYELGGFSSEKSFFLTIGGIVLLALIIGNLFITLTSWYLVSYTWAFQVRLSSSLLISNLTRPYVSFLDSSSIDIAKNILTESSQLAQGILLPLTRILANGLITLCLLVFLSWLNLRVTLLVVVVFGIAYILIYLLVRRPVKRIGERRFIVNSKRFKVVSQAFGSVKEVKILGREKAFSDAYLVPARTFARAVTLQSVISLFPRYIVETLAFGLLVSILLYMLYSDISLDAFLPMASAFALAGYRVLPALQVIYGSLNSLRFNIPVLDAVEKDLQSETDVCIDKSIPPLRFNNDLILEDVSYSYPHSSEIAIDQISLKIPKKGFIAFVGKTGAGKTTVVDIILGLLLPDKGQLSVDGQVITKDNLQLWQRNIGYVPQEIFLLDDSIVANIAFGVEKSSINYRAVEKAAKTAHIHDFITNQLPEGYGSMVGERGVRLSGGERQRIGIARALYHDPDVLVLDEATSALDNTTEAAVHAALVEAAAVKTVIVIAHRISTVKDCDCIFVMQHGRVLDKGTFEVLYQRCPEFRSLVEKIEHPEQPIGASGH